ncbi:hypothetical protein FZEAL_5452 [Fusarium zealandicum]|uniref:Uncharacterized protein n=1 Tax=Fusarium zealandicum TaxID=1053134 RepID=A0A8H4UK45_9HYPO|nr:hypothetical protein FZEAL_5452 [Fusarium zealandicum]
MTKTLAASLLLMAGAAIAMTPNTQSQPLQARSDFCGTDQFGVDWSCLEGDSECCIGTVQGVCMPVGWSCCTTGFYCEPDEECYLEGGMQYCRNMGSDSSEATRTADADSVGESGSSDSDEEEEEDTSSTKKKQQKDNAAANTRGNNVLILLPLVGVLATWL